MKTLKKADIEIVLSRLNIADEIFWDLRGYAIEYKNLSMLQRIEEFASELESIFWVIAEWKQRKEIK